MDLSNQRAIAAVVIAYLILKRRRKQRRRLWVHPVIASRQEQGHFWSMYDDLRGHEDMFFEYTRMSIKSFDELLGILSRHIERQDTFCRQSIPAVERLLITLRYLATGQSLACLQSAFMIGKSTASYIIRDTCSVIWDVLNDVVMAKPTKEEWAKIAQLFGERCNFPNCVGAIDGKHIRVSKPLACGSKHYNSKKYFSFVLLAVADVNYCFHCIDVGSYGSNSDSSVFGHSTFGQMLYENELDLPENSSLSGTTSPALPFVFVGDKAFALGEHLMRPYSNQELNLQKKVFNYRLTRARRVVECAFGILSNKWRFLHTAVNLNMQNAICAVKAACALHNFVLQRDGFLFEDSLMHTMQTANWARTHGNTQGANIRDQFASYFMSPAGELSWQLEAAES